MTEQELSDRQESHKLIQELKKRIGDFVVITVLGIPFGFVFNGELIDVDDELAALTNVTVFPAGGNVITLDTATVNLEVITAVGDPQV